MEECRRHLTRSCVFRNDGVTAMPPLESPMSRPRLHALVLAFAVCAGHACADPIKPTPDTSTADTVVAPEPCNGAAVLCDRRLNEVAMAGAHNAMSNVDEGWSFANQQHGLIRQLDDGIRAFLIDTHPANEFTPDVPIGDAVLCHGLCQLGYEPLDKALTKIKLWLDAHPREVLEFVIEDSSDEASITKALTTSGLLPLCLHREPGQAFPTLAQMIASNQRVFVMTESGGGAAPWRHGYADVAQDNPYAAETVADFSCERLRGKAGNPLLLVNHFLTRGLTGHDVLGEEANHNPGLQDHVGACQQAFGRLPNIVAVDWYHVGDVLSVVRGLNGLAP